MEAVIFQPRELKEYGIRTKTKDIRINRFFCCILVGFCIIQNGCTYSYNTKPEDIHITISRGMTSRAIAETLYKKRVVRSAWAFMFIARLFKADEKLHAGTYFFRKNMSVIKVVSIFAKGNSVFVKVTIPEGFNERQIAERLAAKGLGDIHEYMRLIKEQKLQGYLYPETYFFHPSSEEQEILDQMVDQFHHSVDSLLSTADFTKFRTPGRSFGYSEALILASIVEREAKVDVERPMIAAVFRNRLRKGLRLESCASVAYVLGKKTERLTYKDLTIESPYNTYLHKGLPPAPICSPGKPSIEAVLFPAQTDALFFVKDKKNENRHIFSRAYDDHIAVQKK